MKAFSELWEEAGAAILAASIAKARWGSESERATPGDALDNRWRENRDAFFVARRWADECIRAATERANEEALACARAIAGTSPEQMRDHR